MAANSLNQILTFILGTESYGVDILCVQEIRGWAPVTRIPHAPPHVLGVLNLRGSIIPVVDLRLRFALDKAQYDAVTVIIVLSVKCRSGQKSFGVVVDGVSDVVDVDTTQIRPSPDLGESAATDHIHGILPTPDRMIILLDVNQLLAAEQVDEAAMPEPAAATAAAVAA
jgi:purine-binding chemotaxis protein CheW